VEIVELWNRRHALKTEKLNRSDQNEEIQFLKEAEKGSEIEKIKRKSDLSALS
jgi:hypothetical protein